MAASVELQGCQMLHKKTAQFRRESSPEVAQREVLLYSSEKQRIIDIFYIFRLQVGHS